MDFFSIPQKLGIGGTGNSKDRLLREKDRSRAVSYSIEKEGGGSPLPKTDKMSDYYEEKDTDSLTPLQLAVRSIPAYIEKSKLFFALCPPAWRKCLEQRDRRLLSYNNAKLKDTSCARARHCASPRMRETDQGDGRACSFATWCTRGWCRLEVVARMLARSSGGFDRSRLPFFSSLTLCRSSCAFLFAAYLAYFLSASLSLTPPFNLSLPRSHRSDRRPGRVAQDVL